jgi:dTMP kinase
MWAAESGEGVGGILERLNKSMPARVDGLSFHESQRIAREEMRFARLFLSRLADPASLERADSTGTYVVIEGISGSGKDTLASCMVQELQRRYSDPVLVSEPTERYKDAGKVWGELSEDPVLQMLLLMCDRYDQMTRVVLPALLQGRIVLSVRSYLSTLVYQQSGFYSPEQIEYVHTFVPAPDVVFLLDVQANTAWSRIHARAKREGTPVTKRESKERLDEHRRRYIEILGDRRGEGVMVLDASQAPQELCSIALERIAQIDRRREASRRQTP